MSEATNAKRYELTADDLFRPCDPASLGFETTADAEPLAGALGQAEALEALEFGVEIRCVGYNIFVLGAPGSGRMTFVREALAARAGRAATPSDWCYVYNFKDPRRPTAIELPAGRAREFAADVRELVTRLRDAIPKALNADSVANRRLAVIEEHERRAAEITNALERELAEVQYVALLRTSDGVIVVPARGSEPLQPDAFARLPAQMQAEIEQAVRDARARLFTANRRVHELHQEARDAVAALDIEVSNQEIDHRIAALKERYAGIGPVTRYLDELAADVLRHLAEFQGGPAAARQQDPLALTWSEDFFQRYEVNPVVCRDPDSGAPVVEEANPTLSNLVGYAERRVRFGAMVTDFTRIAAGALHRANGGYLVLEAADVLTRPLAWAALKRALRTGEIRPAEPSEETGLLVTETLAPEPVPLDVKVILIGEPRIYYTLHNLDDEFGDLFKVKVDFTPHMVREPESERGYGEFVARLCRTDGLPPFDASAVARLVEEGSRQAGDQRRLTTRLAGIVDLVREAAHCANGSTRSVVTAEDVNRALRERERRNRRPFRELLDSIEHGTLAFDPRGTEIGQLHGIGLSSLGDSVFGRPIRVMASAFLGNRGVISLEREINMGGPIHNKGVLILSGYLGRHFARDQPLVLSATLSFDQMYEEIDGDSASAAELYALFSAIGQIPLKQGIAVTGALNQDGVILPVGGVTAKLESFFAACERIGLTGEQGLILPRRNVHNLMVRREIREAVEAGLFHVWAIDRVEDGWPILAGLEAGRRRPDGTFPDGTVHHAVMSNLSAWTEYAKPKRPEEKS